MVTFVAYDLSLDGPSLRGSVDGTFIWVNRLHRFMASASLTDTLQETLAVFEEAGDPLTTPEVAERLDLGRRSTYNRLDRLAEHGRIQTKKVGANARVWWQSSTDARAGVSTCPAAAESLIEDVLDSAEVGLFVLDEDFDVVWINAATERYFGLDGRQILDRDRHQVIEEHVLPVVDDSERFAETLLVSDDQNSSPERFVCHVTAGEEREERWLEYRAEPIESGAYAGGRVELYYDVTERKERERELERYAGIIDAVGEPAYELDDRGRFRFVNDAFVEKSGYEEDELLGQHISIRMDETAIAWAEAQMADLLADDTKENTSLKYEVVTKEGERIPVENRISLLTDEDGKILGSAGVLWDITEQVEHRRKLERQREQLAALDNLNDVVRDITDAVLEQSTREEIEATVCERLAESDSYEFAWIAEVDHQTMTLEPRVEAGVEGYVEEVPISMDPDERSGQGPGGRAYRTRTIQTTQDVMTDTDFEYWHEIAEKYGYRSVAAIPIVHGEALYGLLSVYAERPNAFENEEQKVIGHLGEVVGHAIAAIERKRALTNNEVTEIEFTIPDILGMAGIEGQIDGTITFDREERAYVRVSETQL
jgi:PAS domain S-box-containing protein